MYASLVTTQFMKLPVCFEVKCYFLEFLCYHTNIMLFYAAHRLKTQAYNLS